MLLFFMLPVPAATHGADCDLGIHYGMRDTATLFQASCGSRFRAIFAKSLGNDENVVYGFQNNHYSYMIGGGYRLHINRKHLRRNHFDFGFIYIDRETRLFLQKQYAFWFKWSFAITPKFRCGYTHESVPFIADAGRNQLGCDWSFDMN